MAQLDVLIRNAKIVDGTGSPWRYGEIALRGERIVEVGSLGAFPGATRLRLSMREARSRCRALSIYRVTRLCR